MKNKTLYWTVVFLFGVVLVFMAGNRSFAATSPALEASGDSSAAMHNAEGIKHYNKGHWDKAAEHFREAVKADPKLAVAHYNLALCLDKLGEHKDASAHFQEALDLGKDNPDIANSGILKAHLGMK